MAAVPRGANREVDSGALQISAPNPQLDQPVLFSAHRRGHFWVISVPGRRISGYFVGSSSIKW
jgi:hypothetical protein